MILIPNRELLMKKLDDTLCSELSPDESVRRIEGLMSFTQINVFVVKSSEPPVEHCRQYIWDNNEWKRVVN